MIINDYLAKQYPTPPCWSLVADVYATELNGSVLDYRTINKSIRAIAAAFRIALHKSEHGFLQVAAPVDYAIVLLGKSPALGLHHCGIYFAGSVLHALDSGNIYQDLPGLQGEYPLIEFWAKPAQGAA